MSGNKVSLILGVVCVCLAGGLIYRHSQAVEREAANRKALAQAQENLSRTSDDLNQSQQTNAVLRTEIAKVTNGLTQLRTEMTQVSEDLNSQLQNEKAQKTAAVKETRIALDEVADRDQQIQKLLKDNEAIQQQYESLNTSMKELESYAGETQFKLQASEGDRKFLLRELKRLQTEKVAMEREFNDLSVLRSQVSKLKKELTLSRRIEWIRQGLVGNKSEEGGTSTRRAPLPIPSTTRTNYNLNVEINRNGGVNVIQEPPSISPIE